LKRIISLMILVALSFSAFSCVRGEKTVDKSADEMLDSIFTLCPTGELSVERARLGSADADEFAYHFFTEYSDKYKDVSIAMAKISSIPFFVGVVKADDAASANALASKIKSGMNPSKWVCATASSCLVECYGNTVILIMDLDDSRAEAIKEAFYKSVK